MSHVVQPELWHSIRICVVVSLSFSVVRGPIEAQCTCGWSEPHWDYESAKRAGERHMMEVGGKP